MLGRVSLVALCAALTTLTACGTSVYQPPLSPPTTDFSRDFDAPYDRVWSAVTFVAGSTFFNIKNFDKGSGLMTLEYSNLRGGPGPYISCGTLTGGLPAFGVITPEPNSVLNAIASYMTLSGRANITVRARGPRRTTVQVNSLYDLNVFQSIGNQRNLVGHRQFSSREADSQITSGVSANECAVSALVQNRARLSDRSGRPTIAGLSNGTGSGSSA